MVGTGVGEGVRVGGGVRVGSRVCVGVGNNVAVAVLAAGVGVRVTGGGKGVAPKRESAGLLPPVCCVSLARLRTELAGRPSRK